MPEITQESKLNKFRFQQNKEQGQANRDDEDKLDELADFMTAIAEEFINPVLGNTIRDMANTIVNEKSTLAKGASEEEEEIPPEAGIPLPPPGVGAPGLPPAAPQF